MKEDQRIAFLVTRDGMTAAVTWVRRTMIIYRSAVLAKSHYASGQLYRREFIEAYCAFKKWLETRSTG
ncbi:MAG: hypothetical protein EPN73_23995 [Paraburkholderia sp.]|uniref:Uncharacterized protein n=1 Tax=Paraburkholderia sartisoli TaxID=83784 RepID=A0A1H4CVP8_9BURK|nr:MULTISPECIES: hypothetical protein [Paraburkholderia]TAL92723.1 MAG: hypothetical protein EPN73_23995 [Paraburkholderia sp.]SEA64533.1 hypothetical protein SAMN05192564_102520 [Paraburkholderia sartisoli]